MVPSNDSSPSAWFYEAELRGFLPPHIRHVSEEHLLNHHVGHDRSVDSVDHGVLLLDTLCLPRPIQPMVVQAANLFRTRV